MPELWQRIHNLMNSICTDCSVETSSRAGIAEWYMVEHHVWHLATSNYNDILCIGCLENRLGRKLVPEDFSPVPLNFPDFPKSERLADRLGRRFHDLTLEEIEAILR